jgi:Na+-driven multidrug efflux pump
VTEAVGLIVAIWPHAWLSLFGDDARMLATGEAYLRIVGPAYGFFGLGLSLYFASQGAGRLLWPLLAGFARLTIAGTGGWLATRWFGADLPGLYAAMAAGLVALGIMNAAAIRLGAWSARKR